MASNRRIIHDALPPMRSAELVLARRILGDRWGLGGPVSQEEMAAMLGIIDRQNYARYERMGCEATGPISTAVRAMLAGYKPPNAPVAE